MEQTQVENVLLLNVREVARLCGCSPRTIYRLSDGGKMPRPVKIGRWCGGSERQSSTGSLAAANQLGRRRPKHRTSNPVCDN